jgi:RPA family protein
MEQPQIQPRQTAYIVNIKDILSSNFVKEEGWNPNYVLIGGKQVSRINLIGAVISISDSENIQTITIDDGTGKINVKNFDKKIDVLIGNVVLIIGRIRQYGNETYITPEIVKNNTNTKWNLVWKKLALKKVKDEDKIIIKEEVLVDEEQIEEVKEGNQNYRDKIIQKIKDLDDGNGANYEEIIKSFPDENYISKLIL